MYLLYDIVNWPVDEYEKRAWEEYYSCKHKGATYFGNHHFKNINVDVDFTTQRADGANSFAKYRYPQDSDIVDEVKKHFDIDYVDMHLQNLKSGDVTTVHFDVNRSTLMEYTPESKHKRFTPEDKHRYIVFLEDQELGQVFQVGEEFVTWKAGDIIGFPWYMPHCTANCSGKPDRYLLSITGLRDPDRK